MQLGLLFKIAHVCKITWVQGWRALPFLAWSLKYSFRNITRLPNSSPWRAWSRYKRFSKVISKRKKIIGHSARYKMTEIPYHLVIYALSSQWTATRENLHDLVAGELFKRLCVIAYIYRTTPSLHFHYVNQAAFLFKHVFTTRVRLV